MSNETQEIINRLLSDSSVVKFKLKCRKDGLFFIKSKRSDGCSVTEIEIYNDEGSDLLQKATTSVGRARHELCQSLAKKGYTQQEIAAIFQISQSAVNHMVNNEYDPHP